MNFLWSLINFGTSLKPILSFAEGRKRLGLTLINYAHWSVARLLQSKERGLGWTRLPPL